MLNEWDAFHVCYRMDPDNIKLKIMNTFAEKFKAFEENYGKKHNFCANFHLII